jgi:hypothetical protein
MKNKFELSLIVSMAIIGITCIAFSDKITLLAIVEIFFCITPLIYLWLSWINVCWKDKKKT